MSIRIPILTRMFLSKITSISPPQIIPTTEILLVEPIENLGSEGDIVKVRPGYEFFFPRKKVYPSIRPTKEA